MMLIPMMLFGDASASASGDPTIQTIFWKYGAHGGRAIPPVDCCLRKGYLQTTYPSVQARWQTLAWLWQCVTEARAMKL
jgi:hypothetical protein